MVSVCKFLMDSNMNSGEAMDEYFQRDGIRPGGIILSENKSDEHSEQVSILNRFTYIYIAPFIIGIGVIGDLLTIATLTHPSLKRKGIYTFLTFLAIIDLLAQLSVIPPILWILNYRICTRPASFYYAHIAFPLANALMGASVWVVVLLTLYQFRAVCYPLRSRSAQMDRPYIYSLIALAFFANFCVYTPWAFKKAIYELPNGLLQCPLVVCDRHMDMPWYKAYEWSREFLTRLLPFMLIAYFNVNILIAYRNNKKDRLTLSSQSFHRRAVVEKSEKEERRLFCVLFAITIIFFLCTIPAAPLTIFISDQQSQSMPFQIFRSASNLLEITKFALNFYLYCLINPDIRRVCLQLLKCKGWNVVYERVNGGFTLRTVPSAPNSRSGSNKTILTVRIGSDKSSRGSRRSRTSRMGVVEAEEEKEREGEGDQDLAKQQRHHWPISQQRSMEWRRGPHQQNRTPRGNSPSNSNHFAAGENGIPLIDDKLFMCNNNNNNNNHCHSDLNNNFDNDNDDN